MCEKLISMYGGALVSRFVNIFVYLNKQVNNFETALFTSERHQTRVGHEQLWLSGLLLLQEKKFHT